jgi:RNA polymerase sigma-70 factor (ECF subfamily)
VTDLRSDHRSGGAELRDEFDGREVRALSDARLVAAMTAGSKEALSEIYSRYGSSIYGLACLLCRPKSAEDVTHEVFLALWHKPDAFNPDRSSLGSYLLALAHGRAVSLLRSETPGPSDEATEALSKHYDRGSKALTLCADETLRALLVDLSDFQRHALVLAYFGGYTYTEIAARLHQSVERVTSEIRVGLTCVRAKVSAGRGNALGT